MSDKVLKFCKVADVKSPAKANETDGGYDFFVPAKFPVTPLQHGDAVLIPSGIKVDVPKGYALVFMNKSGIATKRKLTIGACVVDHGYSGQVHIHLINSGVSTSIVSPGEKIAQALLLPIGSHILAESNPEDMWQNTESSRGEGGFGSSGTN
jgi:dUTP pyrophosphatase